MQKIKLKSRRVYLEVPYEEKDEAKALGAKWDSHKKKWYIPSNCTLIPSNDI